ncbi:Phosphatidylglycerophosphatase B [compost metagenome]
MQLLRAFILSLIFAVAFGVVALFISQQKLANFDKSIIDFIRNFESSFLTKVMKGFSWIGSAEVVLILVLVLMVVLYKVLKHRLELFLLVGVVAGSGLLNVLLKLIFQRARPDLHRIVDATGFSFPSGHSMGAFTLYGIIAFLIWKHLSTPFRRVSVIVLSLIMIITIGVSRIYLGVHYPSDILGGYLASGMWLAIAIWWYQRYLERRAAHKHAPRSELE